ncbi:ABC transporter ATP-binding protein [Elioraea rosea]|uniref:ABC transporter ATP-binding protein n=1 Tax=Elioraea rosea TaxID=2492390 RepID=UPI00194E00CB|nr:ABC transporter ATP-binding protein [Elioraea rosea]
MAAITLEGIVKSFGSTEVLRDISLAIGHGEFITLVGPSGCGKSTLLRIIAGLERQDRGSIAIGGRRVDALKPAERGVAMVFQSYALYPHMSVARNIANPLEMQRLTFAERLPLLRLLSPRRRRVMREIMRDVGTVAAALQIDHLLPRKPAQLSGGQRQRVALGRAMVRRPDAFLMDEPLSNLDARLRVHMRGELAELHRRLGATFVFVTHDQTEAMTMSDRVALMLDGRIEQLGTPAALYDTPDTLAVAQFIGSPPIAVLPVTAEGGLVVAAGTRLRLSALAGAAMLGLRAEALAPVRKGTPGALPAMLARSENLGAEWLLHATLGDAAATPVVCRLTAEAHATARADGLLGERLWLMPDASRAHLFDASGRRLVPEAQRAAVEAVA